MPLSARKLFEELKKLNITTNSRPSGRESEYAQVILNLVQSLDRANNLVVEEEEECVFDESEQDGEYVPTYQPLESANDIFTMDYMLNVVRFKDAGNSFETVKHRFRRVKYPTYISRFRAYITNMGTKREKFDKVSEYVFRRCLEARDGFNTYHDKDIKRWALSKAREVGLPDFTSSHTWINEFKKRNRIVSRKITKFVTSRYTVDREELENNGATFLVRFGAELLPNFTPEEVINTDQSGFSYEIHGNRTLSFQGERDTLALTRCRNATTHSYTIQPMISASGDLLSKLMIVLQEPSGSFGPRVLDELPRYDDVFVACSTSGKVTINIMKEWTQRCLKPVIGSKCLLLCDSFNIHRHENLLP